MTAYGYIRKSVVHDPTRMLSPEMQEAAIRTLAESSGDTEVVILNDLDISGTRERTSRPGWDELLRAVESGDATAVYAYSLSRFARSVAQLDYFFKLCGRRKVPIRMSKDHIDTSSATGRLVSGILAQLAEFEADIASERVKDAFAAKRAKDPAWKPGNKVYGALEGEDPAVVLAAFREIGSFDGAARLLNTRGVSSRKRNGYWSGSGVRGIVKRLAHDEVGPYVRRGSPAGPSSFRLGGVVACSQCGGYLTGSHDQRTGDVRYACSRARVTPHARGSVNESKLLPGISAEAERAAFEERRMRKGSAEDEAALVALHAKRDRVIDTYTDGILDKAERDRRLALIAADESRLSAARWIKRISIPPDLETGDPAKVNAYLRRLFARVTVDMSAPAQRGPSAWRPTLSFDWREPELRRDLATPESATAV